MVENWWHVDKLILQLNEVNDGKWKLAVIQVSVKLVRGKPVREREREEGGDSQLLRAEDDLFIFFYHSLVWKRRKHLQLLPPKKERKKESFVSLCSLERSARSSLEERSIWILLWVTSCSSRFFQELGDDIKKKTAILESKLFATNRKARGRRNRTKGAERGEVTWPKRHVWHV